MICLWCYLSYVIVDEICYVRQNKGGLGVGWRPSHTEVVYRLLDHERERSGRYYRDFITELLFNFGGGFGRADLVIIEYGRSVGGVRGKTLILYEVKTEEKGFPSVIFNACRQVELYKIGLSNPEIFVDDETNVEKLKDALSFSAYLVIREDLWEKMAGQPKKTRKKLSTLIDMCGLGLITYDKNWNFQHSKEHLAFHFTLKRQ